MPGQGPVSGSYMAFSLGVTIQPSNNAVSLTTFNHALGTTPWVSYTPVGGIQAGAGSYMATLTLVSRTTSYISLQWTGISPIVVDIQCDAIHSIRQ